MKYIRNLIDEDFAIRYEKLLEYFKPKLSRSYTDLSINQTWEEINTVFEDKPPGDAVEP